MLDMSGSMSSRFLRVRTSTLSFVDALRPQDRAQIGTFGEEIAISPHLTGDKQVLRRVLRNELWPMGGTPIWNALDAAMTQLASESGRRVVLTITDGRNMCGLPRCLKPEHVERRAVREGFMLYAIGMDGTGLDGEIMHDGRGNRRRPLRAAGRSGSDVDVCARRRRAPAAVRDRVHPGVLDGQLHRIDVRVCVRG